MSTSARIDELRKKFDENPRRYFAPLANEYRKAGDLEQAVFICQEYLPQQPGHMSGHIVFGQTLFEMGRNEEAKVVFETALSLDPENLIALRHLGDIARQIGDVTAARNWYQRVLEADPRNDEIAQLMTSLAAPVPPPVPAPHVISSDAPTPLSLPVIVPVDVPVAVQRPDAVPLGYDSAVPRAGFEIEKSEDAAQIEHVTPAPANPPPLPPTTPAPPSLELGNADDGQDFLNLDEFNFAGEPQSPSAGNQPHASTPSDRSVVGFAGAEPSASDERTTLERTETRPSGDALDSEDRRLESPVNDAAPIANDPPAERGFDLGQEDGPFELDPYAIAAGSGRESTELAADINLGLVSDEQPRSIPMPAETAIDTLSGLETFESGTIDTTPIEDTSVETDAFFDPSSAEPPNTEGGKTPIHQSETPPGASEAFVTETMAELYLQQGHLDLALQIYGKLAEQRPDDMQIRNRLRAVEARASGNVSEPLAANATTQTATPASAPSDVGPTIREFLSGLVSQRAPTRVKGIASSDIPVGSLVERTVIVEGTSPASQGAEFTQPLEQGARPAPSSDDTVRGSIEALFNEADAVSAVSTDADPTNSRPEPFTRPAAENAPLQGMPAHRASNELSLDHVFKGNSPPRSEPDEFSFDQFFAEDMANATPTGVGDAGVPPGEPSDDIAQFNAWLNGLKKT